MGTIGASGIVTAPRGGGNRREGAEVDLADVVESEWKICFMHSNGENSNEHARIRVG